MHDLGFRTALWHTPYLSAWRSAATQALRDEATQKGYYPQKAGILLKQMGDAARFHGPRGDGVVAVAA